MARVFDKHGNYIKSGDIIGQALDSLLHLSPTKVPEYKRDNRDRCGPLSDALLYASDDMLIKICDHDLSVKVLRAVVAKLGHSPHSFAKFTYSEQDKFINRIDKFIKKNANRDPILVRDRNSVESQRERNALHVELRPWALGNLKLEHPQGASYHHLLEYDTVASTSELTMGEIAKKIGHPELLVVENDWATAIAEFKGAEFGEIRMPFEHACWEFRISGVRVLTFVRTDDRIFRVTLFNVYGKNGVWVADDFSYNVVGDRLERFANFQKGDNVEFNRVAKLVWENIRASCIMLDARVAKGESVVPSERLVEKRAREGRAAPRSYAVVRLLRKQSSSSRPKVARGAMSDRSPQGGHIRRGTWVHYDDPDSGKEQYPNDGGFIVSKTWRPWHFAGDLSRMIKREYRL